MRFTYLALAIVVGSAAILLARSNDAQGQTGSDPERSGCLNTPAGQTRQPSLPYGTMLLLQFRQMRAQTGMTSWL